MLIIDRSKDFYDFYSNIYGIDKTIVYDRRDSVPVRDARLVELAFGKMLSHLYDAPTKKRLWLYWRDKEAFLLLEIGFFQYIIKVSDVEIEKEYDSYFYTLKSCKFKVIKTYDEQRHLFSSPMSIRHVRVKGYAGKKAFNYQFPSLDDVRNMEFHDMNSVSNPILAESSLTTILDSFNMWRDIQTYISSLSNDRNVGIQMTDVGKAETHGFDKHSFRNPIKIN